MSEEPSQKNLEEHIEFHRDSARTLLLCAWAIVVGIILSTFINNSILVGTTRLILIGCGFMAMLLLVFSLMHRVFILENEILMMGSELNSVKIEWECYECFQTNFSIFDDVPDKFVDNCSHCGTQNRVK